MNWSGSRRRRQHADAHATRCETEVFTDRDPIPYLMAWLDRRSGVGQDARSLDVTIAFKAGDRGTSGRAIDDYYRHYQGPSNLSALQFTRDNREALVKAGWTILYPPKTTAPAASSLPATSEQP